MRKILLLLAMFMGFSVLAFSQTRTVTGTVLDETSAPIPFASVSVKGTNAAVASDAEGKFSISAAANATLVVSAAGFSEKEVSAATTTLTVVLVRSQESTIDEVVVTGAYATKRTARSVSSNAQVVGSTQLNTIRQTDINNALAGKVSGLQVRSQSAAALGRQTEVRLRGTGGFNLGSGAIYIVDGTIVPDVTSINPDDIEDVTVLQGPAAAAQFGSQGANGAIVVTLKKGRKAPGVGVVINQGVIFEKVFILPNYQNSYAGGGVSDLIKYTWQPGQPEEWKALDGKYYHDYTDDASWGPRMVGQEYIPWYAWYGGHSRSYQTARLTPQPNNAKDFFNTGLTSNTNLAYSNATDRSNFRLAYGNIYTKGIIPTSSLNRHTFSVNADYDISKRLNISTNINYISNLVKGQVNDDAYSNQSTGSFNQWFHRDLDMDIMRELADLRTPEGIYASWNKANPTSYDPNNPRSFYAGNYWYNFFTWFNLVDQQSMYERLYGNVALAYKITDGLTLKGTYRKQLNTAWSEQKYRSELAESGLQTSGNSPEALGYYGTSSSYSNRQNVEFLLSYVKKFGDFDVNVNLGTDFFKWKYKQNGGFTNNGLNVPNLFTLQNSRNAATITNGRTEERYNAVFGTGTVGYKNYLFADFTLRNDWFSTLPADGNNVLSKSVGASFVFSDLIKVPAISFAKVRASWGEIPQALGLSSTTFGAYRYPGFLYEVNQNQWNGNILMTTPNELVNPNILGAVKTQKEIGLEMRFLKNRLGFSFTYWDGSERDMPFSVTLNGASGFSSYLTNSGKIDKKGIELQYNFIPVRTENFTWNFSGTWSYLLKNDVVSISDSITQTNSQENVWAGANAMPGIVHTVGMRWGQIFGNGIKRINGQPIVTESGAYVNDPAVYFGSVLPKYTGGFQSSMQIYKRFLLNVNVDFQSGGKFVSLSNMWGSFSGLTARTATVNDKGNPIRDAVADGGGVHVIGVDEEGAPRDVYMEAKDYFAGLYNNKTFDEFVYDLTFVKMREISLGYEVPIQKIIKGNWIQNATFSVVARNPFMIYAKTADFDPSEISAASGESGQFPGTRGIGFNLKLGF